MTGSLTGDLAKIRADGFVEILGRSGLSVPSGKVDRQAVREMAAPS